MDINDWFQFGFACMSIGLIIDIFEFLRLKGILKGSSLATAGFYWNRVIIAALGVAAIWLVLRYSMPVNIFFPLMAFVAAMV